MRKESWSDRQKRGTGALSSMLSFASEVALSKSSSFPVPRVSPHPRILLTSSLKCFEVEVRSECCYSLSSGTGVSEQSLYINTHLIKLKRNSLTVFPLGNKPLHLLGFKVKTNDFLPVQKEVYFRNLGNSFLKHSMHI